MNDRLPDTKQKQLAQYWQRGSEDDLETARAVANGTQRFHAALFYAHLAIEKALKAQYVALHGTHAPYTHNLLHLCAKIGWELIDDDKRFKELLLEFNEFNLEGRYPDEKEAFRRKVTEGYTKQKLAELEEVLLWISQKSKPASSS